jgi:hypothetical protein
MGRDDVVAAHHSSSKVQNRDARIKGWPGSSCKSVNPGHPGSDGFHHAHHGNHVQSQFKTPQVCFQIRQHGFKFFNIKQSQ